MTVSLESPTSWRPDAPKTERRPIFDVWPQLSKNLPISHLADLPTPVEALDRVTGSLGDARVFVKRDDVSSLVYGGNKVRTLEVLFGKAKALGCTHIYSTGAFGSNHATAMVLHAPRAGLGSGVVLFPQPRSWAALENLRVILSTRPAVHALPHWSALPFGMWRARRSAVARGHRPFVMVPGGATPTGALGYVSAALELGEQVAAGDLPRPETVLIGVGSTCTSAGLLVGFHLAAKLGLGFRDAGGNPAPPALVSVRVTPWPITSQTLVLRLAVRASERLAELAGDPSLVVEKRDLAPHFRVDGRFLGRGYGYATPSGLEAQRLWHENGAHELDTTYSAKAAAAVVELARQGRRGPIVFWSTKSTPALPPPDVDALRSSPPRMRRWMEKAEGELSRGKLEPPLVESPGSPVRLLT